MSRQELAERINHWIYNHDQTITEIDGNYLGKLERGIIRWPQHRYRQALRAILRANTDQDLGFHRPTRRHKVDNRETVTLRDSNEEEEPMRRRTVLRLAGAVIGGGKNPHIPTVHLTVPLSPSDSAYLDQGISHKDLSGRRWKSFGGCRMPGGCVARRRREPPWCWVATDDNDARCVPWPRDAAPLLPGALSQAVARAKQAYRSCRYTELITVLPNVLLSVDVVHNAGHDTEAALESLLAQAYHVAA